MTDIPILQRLRQHKPVKLAGRLLQAGIFLQCIGIFLYSRSGGALGSMLFMDYGLPDTQARAIENIFAWFILALGVVIIFYPKTAFLFFISLATFLLAYIIKGQGGSHFSDWTIPAHGARYLAPLALIFLFHGSPSILNLKIARWVMAIGLSLTFFTHGLEALSLHPYFIDYIITSSFNLFGVNVLQATAEQILQFIGALDIICALFIIIYPHRILLIWMALWGTISAFARTTELGIGMYGLVLIRVAHIALPLAIILVLQQEKIYGSHKQKDKQDRV